MPSGPRLIILLTVGLAAIVILVSRWLPPRRTDPDRLWVQARSLLVSGRYTQAEQSLQQLAKCRAPLARDHDLRAQVAIARGDVDSAIAELDAISPHEPMAARARLQIGQLELRRNRIAMAELSLRAAIASDRTLLQAHKELIYILGLQSRRNELATEFAVLASRADLTRDNLLHWGLLQVEEWATADDASNLERFLAADPNDSGSRLGLAAAYRRMGRYEEAEQLLVTMPENDPKTIAERARITIARGDEDRCDELLTRGPVNDPELERLRGQRALTRRAFDEAAGHFQRAIDAGLSSRDVVAGLAGALTLSGREAEAEPLRRRAKQLDTLAALLRKLAGQPVAEDTARLYREIGASCLGLGRNLEARGWYRLALGTDPTDAATQRALATL